ncbi:DGQHR domain-containing protein [Henriciella sp.]|uniref:DGQHR domain-containing protein n=1 Tax=Henriciella sp. TaxID=1968823 RepID=UPI0025BBC8A1|nr:DGQHR domain-containing protein [Henriciella sp.]
MKDRFMKVQVLRETVLGVDVVRGFARLCDLSSASQADIYDAETNPMGTQRDLSPKHAKDAYEYVTTEKLAFWPEIFLCVRDRAVIDIIEHEDGLCTLKIDMEKIRRSKGIKISRVDGNHRLHYADGHAEGFPQVTRPVSFCLAVGLSRDQEIKLFRDINNNQRRMNTSHLDNIAVRLTGEKRLRVEDPHLYIANHLSSDEDSPLAGIVFSGGKSSSAKFIPLRTLKTGLEYMFSRPSRLSAIDDIDVQIKLIKNYFDALYSWQPEAWEEPKQYLMLRGAGFWGICFLGAEIIDRCLANGAYKPKDMLKLLKSGIDWEWHRDGSFKGLSGRAGALKIRDMIVAELEDESGASLKSIAAQIAKDL